MNKSLKGNKMYLIGLLPFFLIWFLFEILPLANIVIESFSKTGGNGFTLEHFVKIFTTRLYQQSIFNSLWISIFSALAGIIIAFLGAKAANAASAKVRNIFTSVLNITSNFAGVPLAFAFMILLGNVGILTLIGKNYGISFLADFDLYTINGLLLTYIYFQIPLATLLMLPIFGGLKKEWREAVGLLGGNSFHYWFKVAIPSLLPSILGTFSVLFANSLAAYGTAYALLSNNIALLPIRISQQYVGEVVQNQEFGCALSLVMMALMVLSILITNKLQKRAGGGMA
ncbi:ABC transporter permease [Faecalitalea cylindroides]|mgnify:FL=1|uniref:ABC transporter permease n=1 Tax=Faecalitalea cylindroides TaxID=39483 RepID=UPI0024930DEE|nr:ABC transporter permease subunit [Faecalitalea cylindroides]